MKQAHIKRLYIPNAYLELVDHISFYLNSNEKFKFDFDSYEYIAENLFRDPVIMFTGLNIFVFGGLDYE